MKTEPNQVLPMNVFLKVKDEESGPYSIEQVSELIESARLTPSDLFRIEGLCSWMPIQMLPGVYPST